MSLAEATAELLDDLLEEAGVDVEVSRVGKATKTVRMVRGRSGTQRIGGDDYGAYGTKQEDDFIVKAVDFMSDGFGEPENHDVFTVTDELGSIHEYTVGVDGVERHFDPYGQFGIGYRIHTTKQAQ